jgi:ligand-binding sensor domain-containing protein
LIVILGAGAAGAAAGQTKQDLGKVHFQLYYKPGDWITYSSTRYVTSIAIGFTTVYVGTTGGVMRIDMTSRAFDYALTTSNGLLDNQVTAVAYDHSTGYVWIASMTGLQYYDPSSLWITSATLSQLGLRTDTRILSIGFKGNTLWLHTSQGFFSGLGLRQLSPADTPPEDVIWFGVLALSNLVFPRIFTNTSIGYEFDPSARAFVNRDFTQFPVTHYAKDPLGNTWIGTSGAGVWFARSVSNLAEPLSFGLAMEDVSAVAFDGPTMWMGGNVRFSRVFTALENTGLTAWAQDKDSFQYFISGQRLGVRADRVTCVHLDSDQIWWGGENGLFRLDRRSGSWVSYRISELFHPRIYCLTSNGQTLYVGTESGLNYARRVKDDFEIFKVDVPELRNTAVFKLLWAGGKLFLATSNGIFAWDIHHDQWLHFDAFGYPIALGLFTNQDIGGMGADGTHVYFASRSGVVALDTASWNWESLPLDVDFLSSGINDVAADPINVWVATNTGVLRYIKKKKKWIYYSTKDGLPADRIHTVLPDGDYVWFGTDRGLTEFHWNAPHLVE